MCIAVKRGVLHYITTKPYTSSFKKKIAFTMFIINIMTLWLHIIQQILYQINKRKEEILTY